MLIFLIYSHWQWHLSISDQNPHHTMIGTFLLSHNLHLYFLTFQASNNYHAGVCMPFSCLLSRFSSCEGFRWGIFPIQTIWHTWSGQKAVFRISQRIFYYTVYRVYPSTSSLMISSYFLPASFVCPLYALILSRRSVMNQSDYCLIAHIWRAVGKWPEVREDHRECCVPVQVMEFSGILPVMKGWTSG